MYKCINGWTKTRMIEKIRQHVHETKPCMDGSVCTYQNKEGKRCAAGAFITDEDIDDLEHFLGSATVLKTVEWPLDALDMNQLQGVHDSFGIHWLDTRHDLGVGPQDACIAWIEQNVLDKPAGGDDT